MEKQPLPTTSRAVEEQPCPVPATRGGCLLKGKRKSERLLAGQRFSCRSFQGRWRQAETSTGVVHQGHVHLQRCSPCPGMPAKEPDALGGGMQVPAEGCRSQRSVMPCPVPAVHPPGPDSELLRLDPPGMRPKAAPSACGRAGSRGETSRATAR